MWLRQRHRVLADASPYLNVKRRRGSAPRWVERAHARSALTSGLNSGMLSVFLQMFLFGGVALLALLFIGSADDEGLASADGGGLAGLASAFLSIRGVLAAIAAAGATGALLMGVFKLPAPLAIVGALVGATAGAKSWRLVVRRMRMFDRDHSASNDLLVGREGVLTVGIGGNSSPGVVQLTLGGVSQEYTAIADENGIFNEGARVVIVSLASPSSVIVRASPYPELSSSS